MDDLHDQFNELDDEGPSAEFAAALRAQLIERSRSLDSSPTGDSVVTLEPQPNRSRIMNKVGIALTGLAAAAIIIIAVVLFNGSSEETETIIADEAATTNVEASTSMAAVGVQEGGLAVRSAPGANSEIVRTLFGTASDLEVAAGDPVEADGSEWLRVTSVGSIEVDGWVDSDFVTAIEGDADQPQSLYQLVSNVRSAFGGSDPGFALADLSRDLRISPDAVFSEGDQTVFASLLSGATESETQRVWGFDSNTGDEIEDTIAGFLFDFGTSASLTSTDRISINQSVRPGDTVDNIADFFPGAIVVELHFSGDEGGGADDLGWSSTLLAIQPDEDDFDTLDSAAWNLVGIAQHSANG